MRTMTITIERIPRTLRLGNETIEVEELGVRLPFARMPTDIDHMCASGNWIVYVTETVEMTVEAFDAFAADFLDSPHWLKGKGGSLSNFHLCIEVHATGRPYLYVDPSGGNHAQFVARLG